MDWKEVRLGDLVDRKIGYGIVQPGENLSNGVPVIKVNNIISGLTDVSLLEKTAVNIAEKYPRTKLNGGELVISLVGSVGKTAIVPKCFEGANLVRATGLIDIKDSYLCRWVKYYIDSIKGQSYINSNLNTTVQATLNVKSLVEMPIPLPELKVLRNTVDILSSLDAKIENNNKINAKLEEMAHALFKSWFIDFEPFKDVPFVESELGMIPVGWKVGTIGDLVEFQNGFAFKSSEFVENGRFKIITIKAVQDGNLNLENADTIVDIPNKMPTWCSLNVGDLLLSLTGNVGRCCFVNTKGLLLNQRVAKINPRNEDDQYFAYFLFRRDKQKEELISISRGTAQANLSPVETSRLRTVVPSRYVLDAFSKIVKPIFEELISIKEENNNLAQTRDTLLPKLMSGEIEL